MDLRYQTMCLAVCTHQFLPLCCVLGSPSSASIPTPHRGAFKHMEKQCWMHKHAPESSNKLTTAALWKGHISHWSIMLLWNHTKSSRLAGPGWQQPPSGFLSKCFTEPGSSFYLIFVILLNFDKEQICNPKCNQYSPAWELILHCWWIWGDVKMMKLWLHWVNCKYFAWLL